MKKIYILFFILSFSFVHLSYSQTGYSDNLSNFIKYGGGARPMAMAGAFTSISDDGSAVFWNPAGLAQIDRLHVQFLYNNLYFDQASYSCVSVAYPFYKFPDSRSKTTFGFGWAGMNSGSIDRRDIGGHKLGTFTEGRNAFLFPVAYDFVTDMGRLALGARYIYFNHDFAGYSANGSEFDLGFMAQLIHPPQFLRFMDNLLPVSTLIPWRFGGTFRFPSNEKLNNYEENFPNSMNLGASFSVPNLSFMPGRFVIAYEYAKVFNKNKDNSASSLGAEYQMNLFDGKVLPYLSSGYRFNSGENESKFTMGFGGTFRLDNLELSLNYARVPHPVLNDNNTFFASMKYGLPQNRVVDRDKAENKYDLIRTLLKYPGDPDIIGDKGAYRDRMTSLYKDGEYDTTFKTGVGEQLVDIYKDTTKMYPHDSKKRLTRLTDRLDQFSSGLKSLIEQYNSILGNDKRKSGYKYHYMNNEPTDYSKKWSNLATQFVKRRNKLDKNRENAKRALHMYLHILLIQGKQIEFEKEYDRLLKDNDSIDEGVKNYYRMLAFNDPDISEFSLSLPLIEAIGKKPDSSRSADKETVDMYLDFLSLLRSDADQPELLDDLMRKDLAKQFLADKLPPFPFMKDGFVYDDLCLISLCYNTDNLEMEQMKRKLLLLPVKYPNTTSAHMISRYINGIKKAKTINELDQFFCNQIKNHYKEWATNNSEL